MDYLCLNSELKERVHQKCTGLAMGDPLAETDDQDMNLYYQNSHIKEQGIAYLEQI